MNKVLITAPYMIRERHRVEKLFHGKNLGLHWAEVEERVEENELIEMIKGFHGIICGDDRITTKVLDQADKLQVIVKWGTGIDSIDKIEAEKRGIPVYRTRNAFSEPVADTTVGLMLIFSRAILTSDRLMKKGNWDKPQGYTLAEKTIGIIGLGDVGTVVAKRIAGFGASVLVNDIIDIDQAIIEKYDLKSVSKDDIYEGAEFITLHCDLNPTSFHLLDQAAFSRMKQKPYILNTARGPLIHETALIKALVSGVISGAGLDVFEDEPLPLDSPLRSMENVILSSHNANSSPHFWQNVHENSVKMLLHGLGIN